MCNFIVHGVFQCELGHNLLLPHDRILIIPWPKLVSLNIYPCIVTKLLLKLTTFSVRYLLYVTHRVSLFYTRTENSGHLLLSRSIIPGINLSHRCFLWECVMRDQGVGKVFWNMVSVEWCLLAGCWCPGTTLHQHLTIWNSQSAIFTWL